MGRITDRRPVVRIRRNHAPAFRPDVLAVEEPLEIRLDGAPLTVTMRTPGHDIELAAGFLLSEGVIAAAEHIVTARYCGGAMAIGPDGTDQNTYNVLDVQLGPGARAPVTALRRFITTSSCGVCGKQEIDKIELASSFDPGHDPTVVTAEFLLELPHRLRDRQEAFDRTGGLHAAALFDADSGEMLVVREDVGRHNAVDKVLGWACLERTLPARRTVLQVSGRTSFELVQKAAMAGVPILSAVSAPSSLAVDLAVSRGITLAGFVRDDSLVLYSRSDRIIEGSLR